ncbi:MAG: apolipoprotein N-acyltransferase, partial [Alphaproteobacteria bacterium]
MASPGPLAAGRQGAKALSASPGSPQSRRSIGGLARRVASIRGWRRCLLAASLGALLTAALPPLYVVPLAIVAFTGLVWLIDGAAAARTP